MAGKRWLALVLLIMLSKTLRAQQAEDNKVDTIKTNQLPEILIQSDRIIDRSSVSDLSLKVAQIQSTQGLWEDPLRALTFFPGVVKGGGDLFSASQLYIRGGSPDENLFLMDNVKIYWPWYFGGIKSVFNNETIDQIELLTGGFSAKYGNAMSSVMNVTTRNGDLKKYHGNFSVSFSDLQARIEGPIVKEKVSFLLSIRKTYLDFFISNPSAFPLSNFGDATYKLHYQINETNRISLSGLSSFEKTTYLAGDVKAGEPAKIKTTGANDYESLQWQHTISPKTISKLSFVHAQSKADVLSGHNLNFSLSGNDWSAREDVVHVFNEKIKIAAGGEFANSHFKTKGNSPLDPLETDPNDSTIVLKDFDYSTYNWTTGFYSSLIGKINRFNFNIGGRYDYSDKASISNISPRVSVSYELTDMTNLRVAYGHYNQFPEMDALVSNNNIKSEICKHYIAGISVSGKGNHKGWIEFYYKEYDKLVIYDSLQNYSNNGSGFSKGVELFLSKEKGSFTGWISYAYSIAKRQESLQSTQYYFTYDQRHIFNNVLEYRMDNKDKWYVPYLFSTTFTFHTGTPYTPVLSAVQTHLGWQPVKGEINSQRNLSFHNLNLKIEFKFWMNKKRTLRGYTFLEFWNLYNHKNVIGRIYQYGPQYFNNVNFQQYYSTPFLNAGGIRIQF